MMYSNSIAKPKHLEVQDESHPSLQASGKPRNFQKRRERHWYRNENKVFSFVLHEFDHWILCMVQMPSYEASLVGSGGKGLLCDLQRGGRPAAKRVKPTEEVWTETSLEV